jgi:two-component system sensor histidine kinase TctE
MSAPGGRPPVPRPAASLRTRLLVGILVPVLGLVALNAALLYRQALAAADTAYDRTLLASAKAIGELLTITRDDGVLRVQATLPYSALEAFEADNRSRLYYKVTGFQGEIVSGFEDLPAWHGRDPGPGPYAALVSFYDDVFRDEPIRVALLLQPVSGVEGQGIAKIQVAETLELRRTLAGQILVDTLWRQALLVGVIALVVVWVVQRVTRPVRDLSDRLLDRPATDLEPLDDRGAPHELAPLVTAINHLMARLRTVLDDQKRFVRDTSHQLRTPLAVLRTQVQSAQRGDVDARTALREISDTVDRATELANQMLAMAKVEQLRGEQSRRPAADGQTAPPPVTDWAATVREVTLDLAPLIADRALELDLETDPAPVASHVWPLRELVRNLVHNAIRFSPPGGRLVVRVSASPSEAPDADALVRLRVEDDGPGLAPQVRSRLFQPFSSGDPASGSGLGLAICHGIVDSMGGRIRLDNRHHPDGRIAGLEAEVVLPMAMSDDSVELADAT